MLGFNLLQDLKKDPEKRDELIAKAIEEIEARSSLSSQVCKKEDLKILELKISQVEMKISELEIRILNKMQTNTLTILVAIGLFGLLNQWIFKK